MTPLRPTGDPDRDIDAVAQWLAAPDPVPLVVTTSGSSGHPKQVVLSRSAVLASASASAERLGATGAWVLALPTSYVAGLNVVVRSLVAGHRPRVLGDTPLGSAALAGRFLSAVPTQLSRWLDDAAAVAALAGLHTVLVGGGPVDPALRERAVVAGVHVVATYGSAETCGGCVYDGVPLAGVELALGESDGRIAIRGPMLFDGYADDAARTAQALVDGWFLTSDAGRLDEAGRLQVLGRLDDMVVSGGVNVPTGAVARRLREHPRVRDAEVLGVDDPEWGQRVVAFVAGDLDLDTARDWVGAELPRVWAPRQLVVLEHLPLLDTGKVDRLALRELA